MLYCSYTPVGDREDKSCWPAPRTHTVSHTVTLHTHTHTHTHQVLKSLRFSGTNVPRGYDEGFQRALWVFRHQRVFCPHTRACVHLQPLPPGGIGAANVDVPSAVPQPKPRNQGTEGLQGEGEEQREGAHEGEDDDGLNFLGPMLPPEIVCGIAQGGCLDVCVCVCVCVCVTVCVCVCVRVCVCTSGRDS